jgi:hypothetical protein
MNPGTLVWLGLTRLDSDLPTQTQCVAEPLWQQICGDWGACQARKNRLRSGGRHSAALGNGQMPETFVASQWVIAALTSTGFSCAIQ